MNLDERTKQIMLGQSVNLAQNHINKYVKTTENCNFSELLKKTAKEMYEILVELNQEVLGNKAEPVEDNKRNVPYEPKEEQPKLKLDL